MNPSAPIPNDSMPTWAVLSGDLIGSTGLDAAELEDAFDVLTTVARHLSRLMGNPAVTGFARNRGDGWQLLLDRPALALRAALTIQASLMARNSAFRTRISMATGTADILPRNLNEARGPVFVASGRGLDSMPPGRTLTHADGGAISAATRLADHISASWTQAQARAASHALWPDRPSRAAIAAQIGVTRQAVDQSLSSGGIPAILDALGFIESRGA